MAIVREASGKVEADSVLGEVALPEESVLDELVAEGAVCDDLLGGVLFGESAGRCRELSSEGTGRDVAHHQGHDDEPQARAWSGVGASFLGHFS